MLEMNLNVRFFYREATIKYKFYRKSSLKLDITQTHLLKYLFIKTHPLTTIPSKILEIRKNQKNQKIKTSVDKSKKATQLISFLIKKLCVMNIF